MNPVVYLDNNATTKVAPEVVEAMLPFFTERYGNASSMHAFGGAIHADLERAREKVAALIHADPSEIVFTSCGSESDNMAIFGAVERLGRDTTIITTRVEHPAVLQPCRELRDRGYRVIEVSVMADGTLDIDAYSAALATPGPKFVSMMWANNETGVVFPIKIAAEKGRKTRPDIKLGICGEHGGDPASIDFFHRVGLKYVSCSPYRVPVARLAAAQAALRNSK